jgi:pimeloyl-ACP methyl ester carboxylesterase
VNVVDREAEKYERHSPYAYVLNRPTVAVDPDGKRVYFVGGANNDQEGWNYVQRWANSFRSHGIDDFRRVNMSNGRWSDVNFTAKYRNSGYTYKDVFMNGEVVESTREPVQNKTINKTVAAYQEDLKKSPLKEGEQFNLAGYSYGSVLQAQVALKLANSGQVIDNLILIGSPIGDNSDLYKELSGNKNIKNILRYDLKGDALSNPQDVFDFIKGGVQSSPSPVGNGDNAHHFDAARRGATANKLIDTIVQWLKDKGVKN